MKNKNKLKKIGLLCLIIILLELFIMLIIKISRERNLERVDMLYDLEIDKNGYIGVGISDFHNSNDVEELIYDYKNPTTKKQEKIIASQAKIAKYDKDMQILWEKSIEKKYDSTFYDVLTVEDGYIAVGSYISKYSQIEANTRDAMIVKYDFDGKIVWFQTYSVLGDTEFYKIIEDDDNYVVVGQSIYENMEIGNHTTGGGIIVRYNKDGEEIAHNNYGGNKSVIFTDIIKVSDGYIVCGKDATNFGVLIKFAKDFNRASDDTGLITKKIMWQRTYSNTDNIGFTSMEMVDNKLYVAGAINISDEKDDKGNIIFKYDAGIVIYDTNGKYIGKYSLGEDLHYRINSVIYMNDLLYVTCELDNTKDVEEKNNLIIAYKINEEGKITNKDIVTRKKVEYSNNLIISKLVNFNDKLYYIGTDNEHCDIHGCNYKSFIKEYEK